MNGLKLKIISSQKKKKKIKNNDRPFFKKGLTKRTDRAP